MLFYIEKWRKNSLQIPREIGLSKLYWWRGRENRRKIRRQWFIEKIKPFSSNQDPLSFAWRRKLCQAKEPKWHWFQKILRNKKLSRQSSWIIIEGNSSKNRQPPLFIPSSILVLHIYPCRPQPILVLLPSIFSLPSLNLHPPLTQPSLLFPLFSSILLPLPSLFLSSSPLLALTSLLPPPTGNKKRGSRKHKTGDRITFRQSYKRQDRRDQREEEETFWCLGFRRMECTSFRHLLWA